MNKCRVEMEEQDFDEGRGQWEPVKSLFDYEENVSWEVDTDHATTYKPDAFELELARQEQAEHDAKIQLIINRMMGEV